jgi:hypothetical protein
MLEDDSRVKWGWDFMRTEACGRLRSDEQVTFYIQTLRCPQVPVRVSLTREFDGLRINANDGILVELGASNDLIIRLAGR